jgi:hypothetical protein
MLVTEAPTLTDDRIGHDVKARPIVLTESEMVTDDSAMHESNAPSGMLKTVSGIVTTVELQGMHRTTP